MAATVLALAAMAFLPALMRYLARRFSLLGTLGPVLLCYAAGIVLSFPLTALGIGLSFCKPVRSIPGSGNTAF